MSDRVQINQVGRSGLSIGTPDLFQAATEDNAIALARNELRRAPRASNRIMFSVDDSAHRMIMTCTSTAQGSRD